MMEVVNSSVGFSLVDPLIATVKHSSGKNR